MKTYTQHIIILAFITLFFCRVNAQVNQDYLTITNAPSTDTENGKVVFDNVAANAISWTWNRVIDGNDVFSRTGGDTYSPARVGKFSLVYTISTNESYRIPFSIDIENPNPCANSTLNGDFTYIPQMNYSAPDSPYEGKYIADIYGGTGLYTYSWFFGTSGLPMGTPNTFPDHDYGHFELPFPGGSYELVYLIVKDANGCSIVIKKDFYTPKIPDYTPVTFANNGSNSGPDCTTLSLNATSQTNESLTCDGSVQLNASGGLAPYNFSYTFNSQSSSPTINSTFGNLCAGSYSFKVTDANGCNKELPISILSNPCLNLKLDATSQTNESLTCDGSVQLNANGGLAPYNFSYTFNSQSSTPSINSTFGNLCAGSYTFRVTDANGCNKELHKELPISILSNPCLNFKLKVNDHLEDDKDCNGFVSLLTNGGTSPYLYSYTSTSVSKTPSFISSFSNLCAGNYTFKVIDGNGCSKDTSITIKLLIPLPNVDVTPDLSVGIEELKESKFQIYPNPFKENITIQMKENIPTEVIISDLTGKIVFQEQIHSNNVNLNLSNLESGQYNLLLKNDLGVENQKLIK
jgi:hypothetical protein